jgi:hypothetical protein
MEVPTSGLRDFLTERAPEDVTDEDVTTDEGVTTDGDVTDDVMKNDANR